MPLSDELRTKSSGDPILSADWNTVANEVNRLDEAKANLAGADFSGPLTITPVPNSSPQLSLSGGNWNVQNSNGDFRIGNNTHQLKIGVSTGGGGAGDVRIRASGGTNRLMLGGGSNDNLFITESGVGIGSGVNASSPPNLLQLEGGDLAIGDQQHRRSKIRLWQENDNDAALVSHAIGTESFYNTYGPGSNFPDSIGHKFYSGNGELIARIGFGASGQPNNRLNVDFNGAVRILGNDQGGTLIYRGTNITGTPDGDGFRLRYDNDFFGQDLDALIIEKTDGNGANPDGGVVFVNTGNDGIVETALAIRGDGNVGIGTASPQNRLQIAGGNVGIDENLTVDGQVFANGSMNVRGNLAFVNSNSSGNNMRFSRTATELSLILGTSNFLVVEPLRFRFRIGNNSVVFRPFPDPPLTVFSERLGINHAGDLSISGSKAGYVADFFINQVGEPLEQGDVVIVNDSDASRFYGYGNNIPIPEVDLTNKAYDTRACGIVASIVAKEDLPPIDWELYEETEQRKGKRQKNKNIELESSSLENTIPVKIEEDHPLRAHAPFTKDIKSVANVPPDQMGRMVTLGAFTHCKVDADIAPIKPGDLLTTSPTKGHAQKVLDPKKAVGAILGKALGSLQEGKGKIPIIVTLS